MQIKSREILKITVVLSLCFLFFLAFEAFEANAQSYSFGRNLSVGDTGEDVRQLQKFLNSNPATVVANSGLGSPGNETNYFGGLTKWAVVSFQEQYRGEILTPNGLSAGTGFFGPSTRAKLNSILLAGGWGGNQGGNQASNPASNQVGNQVSPTNNGLMVMLPPNLPPNTTTSGASGLSGSTGLPGAPASPGGSIAPTEPSAFVRSLFAQKISLLGVSKYQVAPGGAVSVSGVGFSGDGYFLHIGDSRTTPLVFEAPSASTPPVAQAATAGVLTLQATIPSDTPTGKYEIWITKGENGSGNDSSKKIGVPFYIFVTNSPKDAPSITNISPSTITTSGEFTISGSGFTSTGNNIYSTLGNITNISSSGGNIVVRVSDFPAVSQLRKPAGTGVVEVEGWLYVQNENGVNGSPAQFKIRF